MMEIRNLTPHAIHVLGEDSQVVLTLPASGVVARAATSRSCVGTVDVDGVAVPVNATSFGEVTGLPDPQPGVAFVVSTITAQAVRDRDDVFIVDDSVRDADGRIIGCRALARV